MSKGVPLLLVGFFSGALVGTGATLMLTGPNADVDKQVSTSVFEPANGVDSKAMDSVSESASGASGTAMTDRQRAQLMEAQRREFERRRTAQTAGQTESDVVVPSASALPAAERRAPVRDPSGFIEPSPKH